jgi:hypothetical protein
MPWRCLREKSVFATEKIQPSVCVRQVLTADNVEVTAACLLEDLFVQTRVQVIAASRDASEH